MFQNISPWDAAQQLLRIAFYIGGGVLVTKGWISKEQLAEIIGYALIAINGLWTIWWNRKQVVTVAGVAAAAQDPTSPVTATTVSTIEAAKS